MSQINWDCSREESDLISKIADRALPMLQKHIPDIDKQHIVMDIMATHCNGCQLRLHDLLAADDFNFVHDVSGIYHHINRQTGELVGCFLPRFARRDQ